MTGAKYPIAEANRVSTVLKQVLGPDRFPVKVDEVAMEYSRQRFPKSPVAKVDGQDLAGFDGMLTANASRSKWLILYNNAVRSTGRKRFTIAHEFGHYMLHTDQQDRFECSDADIETGGEWKLLSIARNRTMNSLTAVMVKYGTSIVPCKPMPR